jgi:hypothetical protein
VGFDDGNGILEGTTLTVELRDVRVILQPQEPLKRSPCICIHGLTGGWSVGIEP